MSKRNAFDLSCAQDVYRINRDAQEGEPAPLVVVRSVQPRAVARRRDGVVTRVTANPAGIVAQNKLNGAQMLRDEYLPSRR